MLSVVTLPNQQPVQLSIEPDLTLYLYGLGLALASGLLCGVAPALRASDVSVVADVQRAGSRGITGRLWLRHSFVVGQVAASVVLLVVSSLFLRSLIRITTLNPGFDLDHGLVATFYLEPNRYTGEGAALFAERVLERVDRIPGVRSSSVASVIPACRRQKCRALPGSGAAHSEKCTYVPQQCRSPLFRHDGDSPSAWTRFSSRPTGSAARQWRS